MSKCPCFSLDLLPEILQIVLETKELRTNDGEVERGLAQAVDVPQLDGVTAAVFLLSAADGQLTAAVTALYGDV